MGKLVVDDFDSAAQRHQSRIFGESLGSWRQGGHIIQRTMFTFQTAGKRAVKNRKIGLLGDPGPLKRALLILPWRNSPYISMTTSTFKKR